MAHARIGESSRSCEQRYGRPVRTGESGSLVTYKNRGLSLVVHFAGGAADMVSYHKLPLSSGDPAPRFSETELQALLVANGGARTWVAAEASSLASRWRTEDGTLHALFDSATNHLMVYTEAFAAAEKASGSP